MSYGLIYYLIAMSDTIHTMAPFIFSLSVAVLLFSVANKALFIENENNSYTKKEDKVKLFEGATKYIIVICGALAAISITLYIIFPNKTDALIIAGLHTQQQPIEELGSDAAELYKKLNKLINLELDEKLQQKGK